MNFIEAKPEDREKWNEFVRKNFPPVGAFLESFEWSNFKEQLGFPIKRYILLHDSEWLGVAAFEKHAMPLNFKYFYAPRGPVLAYGLWNKPNYLVKIFRALEGLIRSHHPDIAFLRLEPAISEHASSFLQAPFKLPDYYVQPRFNAVVDLSLSEEKLFKNFSRDMRHDLRSAERRNIRIEFKDKLEDGDYEAFKKIQKDTALRAKGNIYPSENYFIKLLKLFPSFLKHSNKNSPSLGTFFAYTNGSPVAAHIVIFFGNTATYLFGASATGKISDKAPSYLHWVAMLEAQRLGFKFYDLGGVDAVRWPSLTYFKTQFQGKTVEYIGNVDLVLKPGLYRFYNFLRRIKYWNIRQS